MASTSKKAKLMGEEAKKPRVRKCRMERRAFRSLTALSHGVVRGVDLLEVQALSVPKWIH